MPDHGALRHLTADQITRKVDWCIHHEWLRLEHNRDGIPLIYHSQRGWERVKRLWVERLLGWFEEWQGAGQPERVWPRLETIQRDIKFMSLFYIAPNDLRYRLRLPPLFEMLPFKACDGTISHIAFARCCC